MIDFLNRRRTEILALLTTAAVFLVLMMFTGQWPWRANDYNTYALQADAWLHGRLDLGQDYPWLELAIYDGKYYASFPPFPSYVLLPFAACFGKNTPDHWIALAFAALAVRYAAALYREICGERGALLWVLFLVLGTGYPFIAVNGYVWFFAQSMCFALSLMALTYAVRGAGGLALTLWACAVGCRPTAVLFLPVLLALLRRAWRAENPAQGLRVFLRRKLYWCAGPVLLAASYMALNFLRFGNVFEFGHNYLPEFQRAEHGQFGLAYLLPNLLNLLRPVTLTADGSLQFEHFAGAVQPVVYTGKPFEPVPAAAVEGGGAAARIPADERHGALACEPDAARHSRRVGLDRMEKAAGGPVPPVGASVAFADLSVCALQPPHARRVAVRQPLSARSDAMAFLRPRALEAGSSGVRQGVHTAVRLRRGRQFCRDHSGLQPLGLITSPGCAP